MATWARRVAVRAAGGVPPEPLLPCRSDDRLRGSRALADPASPPDRARRDAPRGGPPQLHPPRVGGPARRDAEPERGRRATDEPLITLPPLASVAPSAIPSADPEPRLHAGRIAALGIDLPVVPPPGDDVLSAVQRRDVDRRARAAGPGRRDVPLRPRPAGDVPPAPHPVEDPEREEADRDGRRGLDERRPAVPVRDHRGPPPPDQTSTTRRRPTTSSSGCRPRKGRRAPSASSRSWPSRCRRRPRTTRRPTRSRTRSRAPRHSYGRPQRPSLHRTWHGTRLGSMARWGADRDDGDP